MFWLLIYSYKNRFVSQTRRLVSHRRRRFVSLNYDLDISYITNQIMSMSVPCDSFEATYRNPLSEVANFFDRRHTHKYMVYNTCPEKKYDRTRFTTGHVVELFMGRRVLVVHVV